MIAQEKTIPIAALDAALESLDHGVVVIDDHGKIISHNAWIRRFGDRDSVGWIGARLSEVEPRWAGPRLCEAVNTALRVGRTSSMSSMFGDAPLAVHSGDHSVSVSPLKVGMRRWCVVRIKDLSGPVTRDALILEQHATIESQARLLEDRRRALLEAEHLDPITGLIKRALFETRVTGVLSSPDRAPAAVIALDIDRLKAINAGLGRAAGDALLASFAGRLAQVAGMSGTVARLGGDEFGVLLEGVADAESAGMMAQRMLDKLAEPLSLAGEEVFMTASAGVAVSSGSMLGAGPMLERAEQALVHAKADGPGQCRLSGAQAQEFSRAGLQLRAELYHAAEKDRFHLVYQPQFDLKTEEIVGVEALLRVSIPGELNVSPARFVPILEATGLIHRVGAQVVRRATERCRVFGGESIRVGVNASPSQFRDPRFIESVEEALDRSGLAPGLLEIELTEGALMEDVEASRLTLSRLKRLGVRIAVDDFGTGYSSLSYLKRFELDTLKIDRAFVSDLASDKDDQAICAAVIRLGQKMGLEVVAEGVETEAQLRILQDEGCDLVQGFLLGRPMSEEALTQAISQGAPSALAAAHSA